MQLSVSDLKNLFLFYEALGYEQLPVSIQMPAHQPAQSVCPATAGSGTASAHSTDKNEQLQQLRDYIGDCQRCKLSRQRHTIVFGAGNPDARLMFIGEAPGQEEDLQGLPFVGDAGMLLTRLIEKMGFKRDDVYIANIIKCRPPMNRDPEEEEISQCRGFIEKQISIIRPRVIMTLGRIALQALMKSPKLRITAARGHFLDYEKIPVMPTFHPAYLLRYPKDKMLTWSDAQKVLALLGHSEMS